ncbi:MAG: hypothetical protein J6R31_07220, partial [Rikenellaceae bacterium]|nr:hypothetical protein [Rikenellaceae bacterium]
MYADVALPIAQEPFTFEVPPQLAPMVACGSVVAVTLGARRKVGGVVVEVHTRRPAYKTIKSIESV